MLKARYGWNISSTLHGVNGCIRLIRRYYFTIGIYIEIGKKQKDGYTAKVVRFGGPFNLHRASKRSI